MGVGKWKLWFTTNSLYFRILAYFLFLLIPILIVGFIVYFANIHIFKNQMIDKIASNLLSSSKVIDVYLRTTEQTGMNFLMNNTVQQYLMPFDMQTNDEREKASSIIKVLASSRNIVSPYIDDMFVYADDQWVYKSEGMESFHSFFSEFNRFSGYDAAYWAQLLRTDFSLRVLQSTTVSKPYTEKQETIIPLVISQYIRGNRVVMATTISASKIMDMLVRNKVVSSTVFLVSDSDHNIIVADPSLSQPELIQQLTSIFENDADGSAQLRLHEQDSMVTMFKSEYGWRYYSVTPTAEYKKQASGILLVTTWLAFLLLVIGIVFSFIFSTKLYNPIRNLLDAQNKHERFSNEFLENAFSYLLSGNHLDKHDAFMSQIGFEAGQYVCCCIKFQFKEAFTAEIQDTDRLIILEKLKKVINGILQQHVTAYVIDIHNNVYVAMVNFKQIDDRAKLDEALHSIIQTFNYDIKYCRLTIGVGRTYSNISDLATSFGDAKMALAKSATDSDFQIVDSAAFPLEESFHFSFVDENKVINALRAGVISLLETEIRTIIDNNLLKGTSHRYMNLLLIELYNIGLQYLAEKGISPSRLLQENDHLVLIGKSPKLLDLHEHLALLLRFCKEIMEKTASPDDNRSGQLVARMIEYIDANYNNDLYLERVAAEMNLSAKYISKLFKETTGTNLADYISIKRISEAKKLLATTNMKNDEIALQIGILSRATFFRLFKKYEGVTPQDYRKMLLSEQKSDDLGL